MTIKISGKVVRGRGKGKQLDFPTVNVEIRKKIDSGVYAGKVSFDDEIYRAGIFVSLNKGLVEAHLIGFNGNLCGKEVEINIESKIRDVMRFESDEKLKRQIKKDIEYICSQEL